MWKRLSHPNIVPFLGVTDDPAPLSMVLEWMPNGEIRDYIRKHPEADRLQLVRHSRSTALYDMGSDIRPAPRYLSWAPDSSRSRRSPR